MFQPPLDPAELRACFPPDRFSKVSPLSSGGQGVVFDTTAGSNHPKVQIGQRSAFKVFAAGSQAERASREVEALKRISCPSLVRLVDHGTVDLRGQSYIYLETAFIEGQTLHERLKQGPLSVSEVAQIVYDVAAAIEALWAEGIVHRDIKPANIMLQPDGHAVVIDLGVARHTSQTTLTAQGQSLGTMGYLAPEQARAVKALSCKCDVFALGITAQQSLLGRHPTNGNQLALTSGLGGTAALVTALPREFADAIDSTLHVHPHRRPQPQALMLDMQPFLHAGGSRP